ncbi:phage tail spike protein [Staphylococcus sp. 10602379]|uniref:phage tail spike protein n=1 Tax=Staphylococcus sp. 10602379 TaxID=2714545 RepID=UPI001402C428|nr:phage tail spike protein [Staphylococcus sp. 10602379]NHM92485.1 hypothetical protein [Staphylococcus sp. 10602379]
MYVDKLYVRDLYGVEHALQGVVSHSMEINGDERIDVDIPYTFYNEEVLYRNSDLKFWVIGFENKEYKIISSETVGYGDKYKIKVIAVLDALHWLNNNRIYRRVSASLTVTEAMNLVFTDTPYTYVVVDNAPSETFEGLGEGASRLDLFKTFIDRYGYEFKIVDKVVYLYAKLGDDTNFEYRHKINTSNITKSVSAEELYTYVEGYGNYSDDDENKDIVDKAKLKPGTMENNPYVSPLANLIGKLHAPPIRDGRITKPETLLANMKKVVDESLKISFSADIHDMTHAGYDYMHAQIGDRVFLVDERYGLNTEIRVVKIERQFDASGKLTDIKVTFGDETSSDQYSGTLNTAVSTINDVMSGRKAIPFEALNTITQSMVNKIQNTSSELVFDSNGIHAIDKNNANNIVTLNSSGMYLSTDGGRTGKTAITAEGISASAITTGEMLANRIRGGTLEAINGYYYMDLNSGSQHFFGNSLIRFHSVYNQIVQSTATDSASAGLSFETQSNPDGMLAYFGASGGGYLNPKATDYIGLTLNSASRYTMLNGDKILFSYGSINSSTQNTSWVMDGNTTGNRYFYGSDTNNYKYFLGTNTNPMYSLMVQYIGMANSAVSAIYSDKSFTNTLNKFSLKEFGGHQALMYGSTGILFQGNEGIFVINSEGQQLKALWTPTA